MHRCPKCKTTELITLPDSTEGMLFFRCATCGREFAKKEGQTITERWLSTIAWPYMAPSSTAAMSKLSP